MSQVGFIRSFGKKAITIEDFSKKQYYCPIKNLPKEITDHLVTPLLHLPVKFEIDYYNHSGRTTFGKRYYASDVKLDLEF